MKKNILIVVTVVSIIAILTGTSLVMAAKPVKNGADKDVIAMSNGFPSGPHYNLNIHGMKDGFQCPDEYTDNSSVFIPENVAFGELTINYVQNKAKGKETFADELIVQDNCGFDGDVLIQLPYEPQGYYVFARILATPNNNNGEPSEITLWPNEVVKACDNVTEGQIDCDQLYNIGLIVGENFYTPDPETETYKRFDPAATGGKGKSKATNITRLFTYSGFVADIALDIATSNGGCSGNVTNPEPDGKLDDCDVPNSGNATAIVEAYHTATSGVTGTVTHYDNLEITCGDPPYTIAAGDGSGDIDTIAEWLMFMADLWAYVDGGGTVSTTPYDIYYPVRVEYICEEFILNIAELVLTGQEVENKGAKLLQIRFYPVASTTIE